MRPPASPGAASAGRSWSFDPVASGRDRVVGARRSARRLYARHRPASDPRLVLRARADGALRRVPGAGRRVVRARGRHDRVSAGARRGARAFALPAEEEVTVRLRVALMLASGGVFAAVVAWGLAGLPNFGHYAGPYGMLIAHLAHPQREIANAVTATVFDYRGFDTMGEELILLV